MLSRSWVLGFGVWGWSLLVASPGWAQVTGVNGTTVTPNGATLEIGGGRLSGSGTNLFHSFQDFNLGAGLTADFRSSAAIANIFARVIGGNASYIDGLLKVSNGTSNLFFINPAGILTGVNARIEVPGSFTATTSDRLGFAGGWMDVLGNPDFSALEGAPTQFQFSLPQAGAIVNEGNISVGSGQDLRLLGGTVLNTGNLLAPAGSVSIAAVGGDRTVNIAADGAVSFGSNTGGVPALLTLKNVPELLAGRSLSQASRIAVAADGTVRLEGVAVPTEPGVAIASGQVDVAGDVGGTVAVLGDRVGLVNAQINASGTTGGGAVLIGGEYQGKGAVPTAQRTVIDSQSRIQADALAQGKGGRVIAWADDTTGFYGQVSARGGSERGDGGFVEISGRNNLAFAGGVDVGASVGQPGQILLDPKVIRIVNGSGGANDAALGDRRIDLTETDADDEFIISETALEALTGDVFLEASDRITIENLADNNLGFSSVSSVTFRTSRTGVIETQASEDAISSSGKIDFFSGSIDVGDISTNAKDMNFPIDPLRAPIVIQANGEIRTGNLETTGGDITLETLETSGSSGNIITGQLSTGGKLGDGFNRGRIKLVSPLGNIQVNSLDAGGGGILAQAGQSFRALGTTNGVVNVGIPIIDDPGLTDYLVSLGYNRQEIDNANLELVSSVDVSIITRPSFGDRNTGDTPLLDGYQAPIVIQYGDRAQTLIDTTVKIRGSDSGKILIQGDSQQAFRMGLAYGGQPPFVLAAGGPIPAQDAINSPNIASLTTVNGGDRFLLRNGRPLGYNSPEFPATASGLVGGIQVGGESTNTALYSSVQIQIFNPIIKPIDKKDPNPPINKPVKGDGDPPPPRPNFSANAATQNASTVAQRDPKTGQLLCPSGTSTTTITLRSAPVPQPVPSDPAQPSTQTLQTQTDPCHNERPDDKIILQLLQDGPNLTGIPQLRPEDLTPPR